MFAPKNFNLPQELINATKKIVESKAVTEEEIQLTEEEEALFEAFEQYLDENFYVDQLTEEEVEYLFDVFMEAAWGERSVNKAVEGSKWAGQGDKILKPADQGGIPAPAMKDVMISQQKRIGNTEYLPKPQQARPQPQAQPQKKPAGDGWRPDSSSRPGGLADPTKYGGA